MRIVHDERKHTMISKCENCGKENVQVRRIEAKGVVGESRGFYNICFECHGPHITWIDRKGRQHRSPVDMVEDEK